MSNIRISLFALLGSFFCIQPTSGRVLYDGTLKRVGIKIDPHVYPVGLQERLCLFEAKRDRYRRAPLGCGNVIHVDGPYITIYMSFQNGPIYEGQSLFVVKQKRVSDGRGLASRTVFTPPEPNQPSTHLYEVAFVRNPLKLNVGLGVLSGANYIFPALSTQVGFLDHFTFGTALIYTRRTAEARIRIGPVRWPRVSQFKKDGYWPLALGKGWGVHGSNSSSSS